MPYTDSQLINTMIGAGSLDTSGLNIITEQDRLAEAKKARLAARRKTTQQGLDSLAEQSTGLTGYTPDTLLGLNDSDTYRTDKYGTIRAADPYGNRYDGVEEQHGNHPYDITGISRAERDAGKFGKSTYAMAMQRQQVANILNEKFGTHLTADTVTEQDMMDVANWQKISKLDKLTEKKGEEDLYSPDLIRGLDKQTNLTGYYKDEFGNSKTIPLDVPVNTRAIANTNKTDTRSYYGSLQNPDTLVDATAVATADPYMNAFSSKYNTGVNTPATDTPKYTAVTDDGVLDRIGNTAAGAASMFTSGLGGLVDLGAELGQKAGNMTGIDALSSDGEGVWRDGELKQTTDEMFGYDTQYEQAASEEFANEYKKAKETGNWWGVAKAIGNGMLTPELWGSSAGFVASMFVPGAALGAANKAKKVSALVKSGQAANKLKAAEMVEDAEKAAKGFQRLTNNLIKIQPGAAGYAQNYLGDARLEYKKLYGKEMSAEHQAGTFMMGMLSANLEYWVDKGLLVGKNVIADSFKNAFKSSTKEVQKDTIEKLSKKGKVGEAVINSLKSAPTEALQEGIQTATEGYGIDMGEKSFTQSMKDREVEIATGAGLGTAGGIQMSGVSSGYKGLKGAITDTYDKITNPLSEEDKVVVADLDKELDVYRNGFNTLISDPDRFDDAEVILDKMEEIGDDYPAGSKQRSRFRKEMKQLQKELDDKIEAGLDRVLQGEDVVLGSESVKKMIQKASERGPIDSETLAKIKSAAAKSGLEVSQFDKLIDDEIAFSNAILAANTADNGEVSEHNKKDAASLEVLYGRQGGLTYARKLKNALDAGNDTEAQAMMTNMGRLIAHQDYKLEGLKSLKNRGVERLETTGDQKGTVAAVAKELGVTEEVVARSMANILGTNKSKDGGATVTLSDKQKKRLLKSISGKYAKEASTTGNKASNKGEWILNGRDAFKLYLAKHYPQFTTKDTVPAIDSVVNQIETEKRALENLLDTTIGKDAEKAQTATQEDTTNINDAQQDNTEEKPEVTPTEHEEVINTPKVEDKPVVITEQQETPTEEGAQQTETTPVVNSSNENTENTQENNTESVTETTPVVETNEDKPTDSEASSNTQEEAATDKVTKLVEDDDLQGIKDYLEGLVADGVRPAEFILERLDVLIKAKTVAEVNSAKANARYTEAEEKTKLSEYPGLVIVNTAMRERTLHNNKVNQLNDADKVKDQEAKAERAKLKAELTEQELELTEVNAELDRLKTDNKQYSEIIDATWEEIANTRPEVKALKARFKKSKEKLTRLRKLNDMAKEALANPSLKNYNRVKAILTKVKDGLVEFVSKLLGITQKYRQHLSNHAKLEAELEKAKTRLAAVESTHELAKVTRTEVRTQIDRVKAKKAEIKQKITDNKYRNRLLKNSIRPDKLSTVVTTRNSNNNLLGKVDINMIDTPSVVAAVKEATELLSKAVKGIPTKGEKVISAKGLVTQMTEGNPATALLFNKDGEIDSNVAVAVMLTAKEYITTSTAELEQATNQDIARLLGKTAEDVTSADRAKFGGLGKQQKYMAQTMAKAIMNKLGLKAHTDAKREEYSRLETGLGTYGILLLEELGYINNTSISRYELVSAIDEVNGTETADNLSESEKKQQILFAQLSSEYRKYGDPAPLVSNDTITDDDYNSDMWDMIEGSDYDVSDVEASLFDAYDQVGNKLMTDKDSVKLLNEELSIDSGKNWPRARPSKGDREIGIRNNDFMSVPEDAQKAIHSGEQQQHEMLSNVVKNLIGEGSERAGKVALLKHSLGWKPLEIVGKLMTKEDLESQKGKNLGIDREVDTLVEYYDMVADGSIDNKQFFDYFYSRNGRIMLDSDTINPQSGKQLHRFLFPPKNAVNRSTPINGLMFKYAVAQSFGFAIDKSTGNDVVAFADAVMAASKAEIRTAITELMSGKKHTELNGQEIEIEFLGQMLVAEQVISDRADAIKAGSKTFNSSLLIETDAKTNGFGIKLRQFPRKDMEWNAEWQKKTGILLGWDAIAEANGKGTNELFAEKGFYDSYQTMVEKIPELEGILSNLDDKINEKTEDSLYEGSSNPGKVKGLHAVGEFLTTLDGSKYAKAMKDEAQKVTSFARGLAKYPFMNKNYGSGYLSTKRTTGNAMAEGMLDDFIKYTVLGDKSGIEKVDGDKVVKLVMDLVGTNQDNKGFTQEDVAAILVNKGINGIKVKLDYHSETYKGNKLVRQQVESKEYNIESAMKLMFADTYGEEINDQLKNIMGEFDESNGYINDAFKIMYRLFAIKFEKAITEKIAKDGGISEKDYRELVRGMLSVFPKIKGPLSKDHKGFTDYISIFDEKLEDALLTKAVQTQLAKGSSRTLQTLLKKIEETGTAGAVIPIHTFDGGLMAKLMAKYGFTNVFDAIVASPEIIQEIVREYNELMISANKDWNFYSEVANSLSSAINNSTPEALQEFDTTNKEAGFGKQIAYGDRKAPITTAKQLQATIAAAANENQANKEAMEKEPVVSGHMVLTGESEYTDSPVFNSKEDIIKELKEVAKGAELSKLLSELAKCKD